MKKIMIGCDKSNIKTKDAVCHAVNLENIEIVSADNSDGHYIDSVETVCKGILSGMYDRGILISNTGQEMNIAANKFPGIRSALCFEPFTAKLSVVDTNANILCIGSWGMKENEITEMVNVWLSEEYSGNNSACLSKIAEFKVDESRKNQC